MTMPIMIERFSSETEDEYQKLHVPLALRMTCKCGKWIMCFYKAFTKDAPLMCECGRKYWCEDRAFWVEEPREELTKGDVEYLISMLGAHRARILRFLWSHHGLFELDKIEKVEEKLERMLKLF